ncbi:carnitine O-palmitoyltransferase 2, mitochondrial-like [Patiria miniata]|uniref:Choline/carnitine acyltransferase domain-containing protein n=1 Tax=Patiria miniata TaxID=46514 RepID=A0A914AX24_PATMI|nr:carnitine O-palmitoyltransferase 2, mitochondrial-like [Patiria miniata]
MAGICLFRSTINTSKRFHKDVLLKRLKIHVPSSASCFGGHHGNKFYSSSSDAEFLHESIIPTMHFQKSLPRLPIPKLRDTCRRYLASQKPLLTGDQYARTGAIVDSFQKNEGLDLDVILRRQDKENKHTNYISGAWFDMYLKDRQSIVLNYNPFITYNNDPRPENMDQLIRATNMVVSATRLMKTLRASVLEPELFHLNPKKTETDSFKKMARRMPESIASYYAILNKAFPLDMSQYFRLFNSSRVPLHGRDDFATDPTAKHVLVVRNGNFYTFDVLDKDGNMLPPSVIHANIHYILQDNAPPTEHPVGYLTSENRNVWATLRRHMAGLSAGNAESLRMIDSAMLCMCLDDDSPDTPESMTRMMLYGSGSNRWFDKSIQVILCKNGMMGVNFEHAWGDGVAVLRFFNEVFKDNSDQPAVGPDSRPATVDASENVKSISFDLDPAVVQGIQKAKDSFHTSTSRLSVCAKQNFLYGRDYLKSTEISPDALMQLSFQIGFYRLTGQTAPTYESCSTAAFKHGRTETLRPATLETKRCAEAFQKDSGVSAQEKRHLMKACSDKHYDLTKEALMGKGWDRHLFGLKKIAEMEYSLPEMFTDPAYANINQIILSTSTLASPAVLIGGFAPVTPNGFGIGYNMSSDNLGVNITSYPESHNVEDFVECLNSSWEDMYEILDTTTAPPKK